MNTVLAIFTSLLLTTTANADTRQDIIFKPIAGEIVSVKPLCPVNATCITDGTVVEVRFYPTSACSIINMTQTTDNKTNTVEVTATEQINTKMACMAVVPGPVVETLSLNMVFPPMTLNFVGTDVSYEILPEDVDYN